MSWVRVSVHWLRPLGSLDALRSQGLLPLLTTRGENQLCGPACTFSFSVFELYRLDGMLLPVRWSIFVLCKFFQGAIRQNLAILPSHYPPINRFHTVLLNVLIQTEFPKDPRRVWGNLNAYVYQCKSSMCRDQAIYLPTPRYSIEGPLSTMVILCPAFASDMDAVRPAMPHPMTMICWIQYC